MLRQIVIEAETPGDSRTMFRLRMDASIIGDGLTAVQAHVLVGEILARITIPNSSSPGRPPSPPTDSLAAQRPLATTFGPRGWSRWRNFARRHASFDEARNEA